MAASLHLVSSRPAAAETWLRAERLGCERGGQVVFHALDIALARGEILQVEGPNGSGKTSLLRILAGLLPPAAGVVSWRGADISGDVRDYHRALCYLGHKDGLKLELTARENLAFACALSGGDGRAVDAALEQLGLRAVTDVPVAHLSCGQRRRAALAQLLLGAQPLWLLDEPFTSLDAPGGERVEALLAAHAARGGLAVVSTHRPLRIACRRLLLTGEV